jgi:predicted kinase
MITVLMGCPAAGKKTTWMQKNRVDEYLYSTEAVRTNRDIEVDQFMHQIRSQAIRAVSGKVEAQAVGVRSEKLCSSVMDVARCVGNLKAKCTLIM